MKKIYRFIVRLLCGHGNLTTTTTTKKIVVSENTVPPIFLSVYPHNVNGLKEDINKICNTSVLTIFSNCQNLTMGCHVCFDSNAKDFETLSGKYFHDYMNNTVYYVREGDGMIMNVGKC